MSTWYYSDVDRNRHGPVKPDDLAQLHDNGQLAPDVLVWREGMPEWKPWREVMSEVLGHAPSAAAAPNRASFAVASADAPAHVSGNPYEVVDRVAASPYAAPGAPIAAYASSAVYGGEVVYAGFWKRFAAYAIDGFIIGIGGFVVQMLIAGLMFGGMAAMRSDPAGIVSSGAGIAGLALMYLIPIGLQACYFAFFHASANQATLGKMAIGIKVTNSDGGPISFARGVGRYFATILSSITIGIGFIMAGFTDRKRALHDMVCDTLVVDRWAFTAHPERQRHELGVVTIVVMTLAGLAIVGYIAMIGIFVAAVSGAAH